MVNKSSVEINDVGAKTLQDFNKLFDWSSAVKLKNSSSQISFPFLEEIPFLNVTALEKTILESGWELINSRLSDKHLGISISSAAIGLIHNEVTWANSRLKLPLIPVLKSWVTSSALRKFLPLSFNHSCTNWHVESMLLSSEIMTSILFKS